MSYFKNAVIIDRHPCRLCSKYRPDSSTSHLMLACKIIVLPLCHCSSLILFVIYIHPGARTSLSNLYSFYSDSVMLICHALHLAFVWAHAVTDIFNKVYCCLLLFTRYLVISTVFLLLSDRCVTGMG